MKKKQRNKMKLDKEEKKILDAYEKGLIKAKHPSEEELKEVKKQLKPPSGRTG